MKYLYPNQVLFLHKQIVALTGGSEGVRDLGLLESAVYRPQASFGGQDLYAGIHLKSAALVHSIICNHPFLDGNKRTGFEAMRLFLRLNGQDLEASEHEKYKFAMRIAEDKFFSEELIAAWIENHCKRY